MSPHRFAVGQTVEFMSGRFDGHVPRGAYTVVRQLPGPQHDREYRLRHVQDGHERVALEGQLRSVSSAWPT